MPTLAFSLHLVKVEIRPWIAARALQLAHETFVYKSGSAPNREIASTYLVAEWIRTNLFGMFL